MQITAIANVVNAVGNYFLIFGVGIFPRLGLAGAAIATTVAHIVAGILALRALFGGKKAVALSLRDDFRPNTEVLMRILNVGIPAGMEQGVMRVGQLLYTMILSSLGTVAYAAHRIALQAESLSFMPGFGFALAATSLVGQALGAEEPEEAEYVGLEAARIAAIGMGLMGVIFLIFPRALVSVFTTDEAVIAQSAVVIRIVAVSAAVYGSSHGLGWRTARCRGHAHCHAGQFDWYLRNPIGIDAPFGLPWLGTCRGLDCHDR